MHISEGVLVLLTLIGLYGCNSRPNQEPAHMESRHDTKKHVLTWNGYSDSSSNAEDAEYILDGKPQGKGAVGFSSVIAQLELLPKGATVLIYPDSAMLMEPSPSGWGDWMGGVPFRKDKEKVKRLKAIARKHELMVWYLAGPPGSCVWENGEEYRIPLISD